MNAIEVEELRRSYGGYQAVRGISFEVGSGELFALLGTNGAGKTTTMEVLAGFARADGGRVRVLELDPYRDRRVLRPRMSIMLQEAGFFGDLTTAETIQLWRGMCADTGRAPLEEDPLELVGLTARARTKVRQLSGGEKRRLDLAMAVVSRPEVLFLDEPTTGMDPEARLATWEVIGKLRAEGATILLTTHYLEEAERLADRLAIMHEGVIHAYGTVEDVVAGSGDRIAFRIPQVPPPALGGVAPVVNGRQVVYTLPGGAHDALRRLFSWADEHGVALDRLQVRPGTLEDVFLGVVKAGRR
ncbi:ABC transporter ATP-binding protein [Thermoactinospora rubra]|uniref:ABC transporter ATP-binding protein n=1 Tax=Thermoactinospora rubra TaxID=1088767 RepID=UPI000A1213EC|nr:ABC transporter ATP-binding protein [Thermoactinospora rubra]